MTDRLPPIDFAARRRALCAQVRAHPRVQPGECAVVVLFSLPEATRNADVDHAFRADSDIAWLTGFKEPETTVVLRVHQDHDELVLFVRPRDPQQEIWTGRRAGVDGARALTGADRVYESEHVGRELPSLLYDARVVVAPLGRQPDKDRMLLAAAHTARLRAKRKGVYPDAFLPTDVVFGPLRLLKSAAEIARLRQAAQVTATGHLAAMAACRPGLTEAHLEAELWSAFRKGGAARHGYNPIVAAGANACILHYNENDAPIDDGALVLIDAGAEIDLYTADVTRTFPANGKFSGAQRALYDIVLASLIKGTETVKAGASLRDVDDAARRVLAEGLLDLGLLSGTVDEVVTRVRTDDTPVWQLGKAPLDRFYMHGTSHWLGMDVHDIGSYHDGSNPDPLAPGMVLTVEPGLYVAPDDDAAPPQYRGIGIRIEDDVLVTADGHDVLTAQIPKRIDDVEAACRAKG